MLFVPFPFVIAILLVVLLLVVFTRDDDTPYNIPFLVLILVAAAQSMLAGLRWGYGMDEVNYVVPVLAATIPALAYLGVAQLVWKNPPHLAFGIGLIAMPAMVISCLTAYWPVLIDVAVIALFVGFAVAILLMLNGGVNRFRLAPFGSAQTSYRAILFAAVSLLLMAALDGFVALDFAGEGQNVIPAIILGNLAGLFCLSVASATASRTGMPDRRDIATRTRDTFEDNEALAAVDALMETKQAYRDPNLNLDRLARKTGIPSRQISSAINRATAKNVSQYVNEFRISEARLLLENTEKSVTEIMFDVGFQTKSNFNREFRRVTNQAPVQWRVAHSTPYDV